MKINLIDLNKQWKLTLIYLLFALNAFATDPVTLPIGSKAPAFSLPGIDGKTYTLKSFATSKILAIVFTCNHCPTAQAYEDRIKALVTDYKKKGVTVIAINPNYPAAVALDELGYSDMGDSFVEMKQRAKDKAYNFPYLFDGVTETISRQYGPMATPHIFIFDQQRVLQYTGRLDASEKPGTANAEDTRRALDELLDGKPVTLAKTKTFGCSVKWKEKSGCSRFRFDHASERGSSIQKFRVPNQSVDARAAHNFKFAESLESNETVEHDPSARTAAC